MDNPEESSTIDISPLSGPPHNAERTIFYIPVMSAGAEGLFKTLSIRSCWNPGCPFFCPLQSLEQKRRQSYPKFNIE
jgi:hypothetical protein